MRKAFMSLEVLAKIVLVLVLIAILIFILKRSTRGAAGALTGCEPPNQCLSACPAGATHVPSGDEACQREGFGSVCCLVPEEPGPGGILPSDIRVYFQGDKERRVRSGSLLELAPTKDGGYAGRFTVTFGPSIAQSGTKRCYGQVSIDDGPVKDVPISRMFEYSLLKGVSSTTGGGGNTTPAPCPSTIGGRLLIPVNEAPDYLGRRIKYTIVVYDEEECGDLSYEYCEGVTHHFFVTIPDRNPRLALLMNGKEVSEATTNRVPVGKTTTFEAVIEEPFATCEVGAGLDLLDYQGKPLMISGGAQKALPLKSINAKEEGCFDKKKWRRRFHLNLPADAPRGIPFTITFSTTLPRREAEDRVVTKRYSFLIEPEDRVRVLGPAPGLTREKTIDVACSQSCTDFTIAFLKNPLDCRPTSANSNSALFEQIGGLASYGGEREGRFRFTLRTEGNNTLYPCVRARILGDSSAEKGFVYSLGLWRERPAMVTIDATPPALSLSYNPFTGILKMNCEDQPPAKPPTPRTDYKPELFVSGCGQRPFSYAYVSNPLIFGASIVGEAVSGGKLYKLSDAFHACPDPDTGSWLPYNSNRWELEYKRSEVRVICVRATDNAGNHVVKPKLLWSSQEAIGLLLASIGRSVQEEAGGIP